MKKIIAIIIPIIVGALLYYLFCPEVFFVRKIDEMFGISFHPANKYLKITIVKIARNYIFDVIWGYALFVTLYFLADNNAVDIKKFIITGILLVVILEGLQLLPNVDGTFDVFDILIELVAGGTAVFIIKILSRRKSNE